MIALSMVLRGHTMSLGGIFMMLRCFVMCVFCHVDVLWNRYFDSLNPKQVMNHWTLSSAHPFLGEWRIPAEPLEPPSIRLADPFRPGRMRRIQVCEDQLEN